MLNVALLLSPSDHPSSSSLPHPQPFISNELPTQHFVGPLIRVLYSVAIMFTFPLQLFPATLIVEEYVIQP